MENEKKNGQLLDALLGDQPETASVDAKVPVTEEEHVTTSGETIPDTSEYQIPEGATTVDLTISRWVLSADQIDWDTTELEDIDNIRKALIADRFNLIVTEDETTRVVMADEILKKMSALERNLGIYIDYFEETRRGISKCEAALLAITDGITIYEWLKNQILFKEQQEHLGLFLEEDNISTVAAMMNAEDNNAPEENTNEKETLENYVPKDPAVQEALKNSLVSSFMDDHDESGLLS